MRVFHTTSRKALRSINATGLKTSYALRKRAAVWLHARSLSMWAFLHVGQHKRIPITDMVCIEFDVPRSWLRRYSDGVWYCSQDVPPDKLRGVRYYGVTKQEIFRR